MNAGRLSERIIIERATETEDGAGGFTRAWTTLAERWAEARPVRGREGITGAQTVSIKTWLFAVRKDMTTTTLTARDRLRWDGQLFNILSIRRGLPDGKNLRAFMTIEAETDIGSV